MPTPLRTIRRCLSRAFLVVRFPDLNGLNLCIKLSILAPSSAEGSANGSTIHRHRSKSTHSQASRVQAKNKTRGSCKRRGNPLLRHSLPRIGVNKSLVARISANPGTPPRRGISQSPHGSSPIKIPNTPPLRSRHISNPISTRKTIGSGKHIIVDSAPAPFQPQSRGVALDLILTACMPPMMIHLARVSPGRTPTALRTRRTIDRETSPVVLPCRSRTLNQRQSRGVRSIASLTGGSSTNLHQYWTDSLSHPRRSWPLLWLLEKVLEGRSRCLISMQSRFVLTH